VSGLLEIFERVIVGLLLFDVFVTGVVFYLIFTSLKENGRK